MSNNSHSVKLAFVCVQNAGRSQMATAFAEIECNRRGVSERVDIQTGGTHPAENVHPAVVETMNTIGVDLTDRKPQLIEHETLRDCDLVVTMGCSTLELDDSVETREWSIPDPEGKSPDEVTEIREEIRRQVRSLFDEIADNLSEQDT